MFAGGGGGRAAVGRGQAVHIQMRPSRQKKSWGGDGWGPAGGAGPIDSKAEPSRGGSSKQPPLCPHTSKKATKWL